MVDREELRRRFHRPTARDEEVKEIRRQQIERGEVAESHPYDPTQAIGLDDNLDPFPLTSAPSDKPTDTREDTDETDDV